MNPREFRQLSKDVNTLIGHISSHLDENEKKDLVDSFTAYYDLCLRQNFLLEERSFENAAYTEREIFKIISLKSEIFRNCRLLLEERLPAMPKPSKLNKPDSNIFKEITLGNRTLICLTQSLTKMANANITTELQKIYSQQYKNYHAEEIITECIIDYEKLVHDNALMP